MTPDHSPVQEHSAGRGFLWALLGFAVFSTHDAIVKILADYSVFQIIFFAMLFGYVPFSLARIADSKAISLKPINPGWVWLRALLSVLGVCFAFTAFSMLPMVQVYVLLFTTPLIISVLAIPLLGEKVHLFRWMAILLGLVGIVIVLRPSADSVTFGHLFALSAAFCSAGAAVISRKVAHEENAATMILYPLILNIVVTGCFLYFVYKPMPLLDLSLMFAIGFLGLMAQYFLINAYRSAPAAIVAPMQYSQLIWAVVFGALFFNEDFDRWVIVGSLITILSGLLIIWRETKVSATQPNLRTRNSRIIGGPSIQPVETEEAMEAAAKTQ